MTSGYVAAAATAVSSWPAANPLKNWSILFLNDDDDNDDDVPAWILLLLPSSQDSTGG